MRRAKVILLTAGTMSILGAAAWTQQLMFSPRQKPSPAIPMTNNGQEQAMDYDQALALQQGGHFSSTGSATAPVQAPSVNPTEGAAPVGVDPEGNPVFGAVPEPAEPHSTQNEAQQAARAYRADPGRQEGYPSAPGNETIGGYPTQMPQGGAAPAYPQAAAPQPRGAVQPGYSQPGYSQPEYAQPSYPQPRSQSGYPQRSYAQQPGYPQPTYAQPSYREPYGEPAPPQLAYNPAPPVQSYDYLAPAPQVVQASPVVVPPARPIYPPAPVIAYDYPPPYPYAYGSGVRIVAGYGPYYRHGYPVAPVRPYPVVRRPFIGHVPLAAGYPGGRSYPAAARTSFAPATHGYSGYAHIGGYPTAHAGYVGGARAYAGPGRSFGGGYGHGGYSHGGAHGR